MPVQWVFRAALLTVEGRGRGAPLIGATLCTEKGATLCTEKSRARILLYTAVVCACSKGHLLPAAQPRGVHTNMQGAFLPCSSIGCSQDAHSSCVILQPEWGSQCK
jgi:hypothetical protein